MKKRMFLSLFAILFVAIFALSVCFFTACKGGDDDADDGVKTEEPDGTGEGEGEGNEPGTEGGEEKGAPLTGEEDIIGTWTGSVEITATAFVVFSGEIYAEMTVEITEDSLFALSFIPTAINFGESLGEYADIINAALAAVGLAEGTEFAMFADEPVYIAEDGTYYADIDGDYVKCQLPLETNEAGQLCIAFDESLDFSGIAVEIAFDATLDKEGSDVPVEGTVVTLNHTSETLKIGDTLSLTATVTSADGTYSGSYAWTSSNEDVATVSQTLPTISPQSARVTAVAVGEADITVTLDDGESATCKVTVVEAPTVESVSLTSETLTLEPDETAALEATIVMSDGSDYDGTYTWTSSNTSVATVEAVTTGTFIKTATNKATVTAIAAGETTITLALDDDAQSTATCDVTVNAFPVTIYGGKVENFGMNGCFADFENANALGVAKTTGVDGAVDYAVSGVATLMTQDQIYAFNGGQNENGAKNGDAFIIIEIAAPAGSTIDYNGKSVELGAGETSEVFIQKISKDDVSRVKTISISESGTVTSTFTISLDGVIIPDTELAGTWSSESISATALYFIPATAAVELTVNADGSYTLSISNIEVVGYDLTGVVVGMTGAWVGGEGTYILTGEEGNEVTVILTEDEEGEQVVQMSFDITYELESMSIPISVSNAVLSAGALSSADAD